MCNHLKLRNLGLGEVVLRALILGDSSSETMSSLAALACRRRTPALAEASGSLASMVLIGFL